MAFIIKLFFLLTAMLFSFASAEPPVEQESRSLLFWCYSHYRCPSNSYHLPYRWCISSFKDCGCNHGYYKSKDTCVLKEEPIVDPVYPPSTKCFTCPSNSYGKVYSTCYKSFNDCECKKGYYKSSHENKCVKQGY